MYCRPGGFPSGPWDLQWGVRKERGRETEGEATGERTGKPGGRPRERGRRWGQREKQRRKAGKGGGGAAQREGGEGKERARRGQGQKEKEGREGGRGGGGAAAVEREGERARGGAGERQGETPGQKVRPGTPKNASPHVTAPSRARTQAGRAGHAEEPAKPATPPATSWEQTQGLRTQRLLICLPEAQRVPSAAPTPPRPQSARPVMPAGFCGMRKPGRDLRFWQGTISLVTASASGPSQDAPKVSALE